jgi:methyl-accepting chemotaxis protein
MLDTHVVTLGFRHRKRLPMTTGSENNGGSQLDRIDERFAALLAVSERQSENYSRQNATLDRINTTLDRQSENLDRLSDDVRDLVTSSREQRRSIEELVIASREQRQTVQLMAGMVSELVRAIAATSKNTDRILASAERAAQASEAAAAIAQSNQNAIRDLIAEMRESRS